ncbi:MAG: hypothetical protein HC796_06565 [Synechococcaceae cyanobacterium RL_1_2]|nr:hypothetical protein [Synechococcaceae cyanobacterium RL_1_2]
MLAISSALNSGGYCDRGNNNYCYLLSLFEQKIQQIIDYSLTTIILLNQWAQIRT